jgi:hypothetical protein
MSHNTKRLLEFRDARAEGRQDLMLMAPRPIKGDKSNEARGCAAPWGLPHGLTIAAMRPFVATP